MHIPDIEIIAGELSKIDVIRPLWEDLLAYNSALHRGCYGYLLHKSWVEKKEEFKKRSEEGFVKFDLVKAADSIVGYCISTMSKALEGEIVSLYLRQKFRRNGIGTRLVSDHLQWLRANNAKHIYLYVHPCNVDAIQFHWTFGFFSNSPLMELCAREE